MLETIINDRCSLSIYLQKGSMAEEVKMVFVRINHDKQLDQSYETCSVKDQD